MHGLLLDVLLLEPPSPPVITTNVIVCDHSNLNLLERDVLNFRLILYIRFKFKISIGIKHLTDENMCAYIELSISHMSNRELTIRAFSVSVCHGVRERHGVMFTFSQNVSQTV